MKQLNNRIRPKKTSLIDTKYEIGKIETDKKSRIFGVENESKNGHGIVHVTKMPIAPE